MLTLKYIRENREGVLEGLKKRNFSNDRLSIVDQIVSLDDSRKAIQTERDEALSEVNSLSRKIGELYKAGNREEGDRVKLSVNELKQKGKSLDDQLDHIKAQLNELLLSVPNVPHPTVPFGNSDDDNEVVKPWPNELKVNPQTKPHWEIAKEFDLLDFDAGVKITGSGFPLYKGKGARLERALINFFLDEASDAGYQEIIPPLLVNPDTAQATGQLPDKEGQMYHCEKDDLYLIPTAEVPITNIYRNEIVDSTTFPIKLTGYTPCFRREAGSYGADVKGLNRVHQFNKVEIVQVTHPDRSYTVLDEMVEYVGTLLEKLELPYRILRLCGGDLGFTSALTYDFEIFSEGQGRWLEVSSVSNFETYQTNRLKLRFKAENGKTVLAHTLNGSALALARIMAGLLEKNYSDNGVVIPEVLRPYTRFEIIS